MKTLNEIKTFIKQNNAVAVYNQTALMDKGKADKQIEFVLSNLKSDEDVTFAMLTNRVNSGNTILLGGLGCMLITNRRILVGRTAPMLLGGNNVKSINIDKTLDITSSNFGITSGSVCVNTRTEKLTIEVLKERVHDITNLINNSVDKVNDSVDNASRPQASNADELLKYKSLLDSGIISQDEFDKKKKELLGL